MEKPLTTSETQLRVRFNEVDSLDIVWHGHYINYFEQAREEFGRKYNIDYLTFKSIGVGVPIVDVQCRFIRPLKYGDEIVITTEFIPTKAAKIIFKYRVYKRGSDKLIAEGKTVQVFINAESGELLWVMPDIYNDWLQKAGVNESI